MTFIMKLGVTTLSTAGRLSLGGFIPSSLIITGSAVGKEKDTPQGGGMSTVLSVQPIPQRISSRMT